MRPIWRRGWDLSFFMGALPDRRLVALATSHRDFMFQDFNALFLVSEHCVEFGGDSGHLHFFGSSLTTPTAPPDG